jgi:hypothetical protein
MADELIRAAVYLDSAQARKLAGEALKPLTSAEPGNFSGVAEGLLAPDDVERLNDAGVVVELLGEGAPAAELEALSRGVSGSPAQTLAENADVIDEIKQAASTIPTGDDNVYNIELTGPITREQRLELDRLGVDIAALEPGFGYRTFLTRKQYAQVDALPYVERIKPYSVEQALTPELLNLVREGSVSDEGVGAGGASARPELMSEGEEVEFEPQVFNCLLHREQDLAKVSALIDENPGTTIIGTSNLRVRFSADVHLPLIAMLATLPEVRKVSPYQAPTL